MIKCPACNENWIQESEDFVCKTCVPGAEADMIVYQVHSSILDVDKLSTQELKSRLGILRRAKDHLEAIIVATQKG